MSSQCVCHIVLPQPTSVHDNALDCALCHRSLFKTAIDNALDTMTALNEKLVNQRNHCDLLLMENHSLRQTIAQLEAKLNVLQQDNEVLGRKLIAEAELRGQLLHENDLIMQELNELTESVFNEANNLVSAEARKRFEEEALRTRILRELDEARKQQELDQEQLRDLKEKFDHMIASPQPPEDEAQKSDNSMDLGQFFALGNENPGDQPEYFFCPNHVTSSSEPHSSTRPGMDAASANGASPAPPPTSRSVDPDLFAEFQCFLREYQRTPARLNSLPFMRRCIEEDFEPCLKGLGWMTFRRVLEAFSENTCFVERVSGHPESELLAVCAACDQKRVCQYRFKLRPGDSWKPLDAHCRERLAAVGNFYAFLRAWRSGSRRTEVELFQTCHRLRAKIFLARSGLSSSFSGEMMVKTEENPSKSPAGTVLLEEPGSGSSFTSFLMKGRKSATHIWSLAKEFPHHLEGSR